MAFSYDTVTIGSEPYTSLLSLEDADNYLAASTLFSVWDALEDNAKGRFLVSATRLFDRLLWKGSKADDDNSHSWPRSGISGVADDAIPAKIKDAVAEMAVGFANGSTAETSTAQQDNIKRLRADTVEIENFRSTEAAIFRFPLPVQELISEYLDTPVIAPKSTGTGVKSSFTDDYGFNRGI